MIRKTLTALIVFLLLFITGCAELEGLTRGLDTSSPAGPEMVRKAELGSAWQMNQMKLKLAGGEETSILLKVTDGGKVDGYFYLERGGDMDFQIIGDSLIYESKGLNGKDAEEVTSDRFSFTAARAQGTTYTLTFRNPGDNDSLQSEATIFLEIIYPTDSSLFMPVETK